MRYDIIGDIHGCADELVHLLYKLGYMDPNGHYDRTLVFVGDLTDRGPKNVEVLRLVMDICARGFGLMVMGNHCNKLMRFLKGNNVTISHGLEGTVQELESCSQEFRDEVLAFLQAQPTFLNLDGGSLRIVHAAAPKNPEGLTGKAKKKAKAHALYGVTTGKTDADGFPERVDWAETYDGDAIVVHGHVVVPEVVVKNGVWNIDTGCVFGGKLTALRYPEMEIVQVQANQAYSHKDGIS